ncbi:hypothetical protein M0R01_03810 [bacterium]|nr:hypothetical protein [bacterium]
MTDKITIASIVAFIIFVLYMILFYGSCHAGIPVGTPYHIKAVVSNGQVFQTGQSVQVGILRNSDLYWYDFVNTKFISNPANNCYDDMTEYDSHPLFGFYDYSWTPPIRKKISISSTVGTISVGDTVKGCTSLANGTVLTKTASYIIVDNIFGTFQNNEKICLGSDTCSTSTNYFMSSGTGVDVPEIYTFFAICSGDIKLYSAVDISTDVINFYFGQ